ncbi:MAG: transcriptional regulator [Tannerella sp.]|jgi:DNA-binding XRE family transcriptional regulator|nr:transcriptional regulator [Tannerella sp.]
MNYKKIHLGKLIQAFVKENNINSADLARKIGKTRQNIYDIYKRDDIEVKLFLAISDVLQHDFIDELRPSDRKKTDLDAIFNTLKRIVEEKLDENSSN